MTEENLDCFKIPDISRRDCDIMSAYMISAGGGSAEKLCSTTDDVLEYMLGDDKLRDVVTKVNVIGRTL